MLITFIFLAVLGLGIFIGYRIYQTYYFWLSVNPDNQALSWNENLPYFLDSLKTMLKTPSSCKMIVDGSLFKVAAALDEISDEQLEAMDLGIEALDDYLKNFFRPSLWDAFYDCERYQWKKKDIYIYILHTLDVQYNDAMNQLGYTESYTNELRWRLKETFGVFEWGKYIYPDHNRDEVSHYVNKFIDLNISEIEKSTEKDLLRSCFVGQILSCEKLILELGMNFPTHLEVVESLRKGVSK